MDLTSLPPAPWSSSTQKGIPGHCMMAQLWGSDGKSLATAEPTNSESVASAVVELAALARNALDVLERRRTWILRRTPRGKFYVEFWAGVKYDTVLSRERAGYVHYHDDPFTALTKSDEWFKKNVEAGPTE